MVSVSSMAFLLAVAAQAAAQEPQIEVEAGASEIYVGESVNYHVEIRNTREPSPPDLSALRDEFEVAAQGDESRNQSSTFVVNGRVTQRNSFSHVYHYRLTPRRSGKLTIAAPRATIEGKTIAARELPLLVIAPEEQDLVVPEIVIGRPVVFPTQPFEVKLRVLVRPLPNDAQRDPLAPLRRQPPHLEVNWVDPPPGLTDGEKSRWLEPLLSDDGGGFTLNDVSMRSGSFFEGPRPAVFNLYQGRETREGTDGQEIDYFVYELKRTFTSEKAATYPFGPALVKGTFVDGIDQRSYTARRLVAAAQAVAVTVREVPAPRPTSFCGGIGAYRVAASAHPTTLRVGDPLTLTLDVRRGPASGSLDLISAPELADNVQLAADFEIVDKKPTGRIEGEAKRFAYAVRPRRAGVQVPPLTVTVFDPDTETFVEIATAPIALDVTAAAQVGAGDLVGALPASGAQEIKSREQGIFQNVTDPSQLT
ncbi:MAG TPA: BatD family protein, partial [Pirellulales bacterium]|nr:BatD family protein [Pirellulales bacterium]